MATRKTRKADIVIIGAGTAGLSAYGTAKQITQDIILINEGQYGTTCARVGCMPSKVFIQAANDFHRRHQLAKQGIQGGEQIHINTGKVLEYVRSMRDYFVSFVLETIEDIGENNIHGRARFLEPATLQVNEQIIQAGKVILANGSTPFIPEPLTAIRAKNRNSVLTTDELFELESLPESVAVIGTGPLGLELGQAMHRMEVATHLFGRSRTVGGLTDADVIEYAIDAFQEEFPLSYTGELCYELCGDDIAITWEEKQESRRILVNAVLVAAGRRPNVRDMGLEEIGVPFSDKGVPQFNPETMQIANFPIFIAGDVTGQRPVLHEASDEGRIAGWNCAYETVAFQRRTPLAITFSEPNIVRVGKSRRELTEGDYHTGAVLFDSQGRATIQQYNKGMLHIFGDKENGLLLGAEMIAPAGEHMGHLLSWAIENRMTVFDALAAPFYHPVVEEGLRTCLRDLAKKIDPRRQGLEIRFKSN
ncbi:dihydrolipoamide dehydrogenase [Nitrosomonas sp. Nm51]|uniref:dihydrolipoyl dehydrogenase n=1 Tax=Nitrosomonas sp. Nm51 TaxID=133720 RepID=UPI0008D8469D|nr:dihydrolipoyl dehydrogenase [Nitrosomonas sp. Nm51]SER74063.1 dihydrolipoamide dehydrogenase [Nitrosomonas sp. Nm51]